MAIFSRKKEKKNDPKNTNAPAKATAGVEVTSSSVVLRPLLTEKAALLEMDGVYSFIVASNANKSEIKKYIERMYKTKVSAVKVVNKKSKKRLWRGKLGKTSGYKKAYVKLAAGQKIEVIPK